ncbi:amino acid transporter, putative [Trypanosoma brucei gambiense DAL972]|uniref:Amino acid transporter, putative n=1 Tax=Trypanosoma brucei gambiense (strain MHOM/CI/86/DAL972) TaxID=679716 RepID=C9ZVS1_TRYB9|nr:amino acid transporter, putative [Trypanosoma brucei gambiense DAL972]CBH13509.1 amino acid transporter, putative [Trypanosoma brucei gambiense DAL972]|eukprot:XP_011775786.1 amino acid transporter, putative [Trypanosoma brucei gambiense DAL972]
MQVAMPVSLVDSCLGMQELLVLVYSCVWQSLLPLYELARFFSFPFQSSSYQAAHTHVHTQQTHLLNMLSPTEPLGSGKAHTEVVTDEGEGYGAMSAAEEKSHHKNGDTPTTDSKFMQCINAIIPHGGSLSTTFNLGSATLGAGVISLAIAFQMSGVIPSILILITVTVLTIYSVGLMMQAVEMTGYNSYADLSRNLFGPGWDYFTISVSWLFTFGTCVSYVIATGYLVDSVLSGSSALEFFQGKTGNRVITSIIWFVGMFSLSLPKEINSLRYASAIAVLFVFYFVICIVVHSAKNGLKDGKLPEDVEMFKSGNRAIEGLSIFMFSYLCHMNCFSIYSEMRKPSARRMTLHTTYSMSMCCVVYIIAGFFGYTDVGNKSVETVFEIYDVKGDVMMAIAFAGMLLKICVGFSLCMQPARDCCYYIIGWDLNTLETWKNCLFCGCMALCALLLGLFIPDLNTVFGLLGSFCGGVLGFCIPALYRMYCGNWGISQVGVVNYVCTYLLLISGVIAVVFGTAASIYNVAV